MGKGVTVAWEEPIEDNAPVIRTPSSHTPQKKKKLDLSVRAVSLEKLVRAEVHEGLNNNLTTFPSPFPPPEVATHTPASAPASSLSAQQLPPPQLTHDHSSPIPGESATATEKAPRKVA